MLRSHCIVEKGQSMKKKYKHGGVREGAGRPTLPKSNRMRNVSIMLREHHIEQARHLGRSVGEGIRRLLDAAAGRGQ